MKHRILGGTLSVSTLGLGCMGMTWAYGAKEKDKSEALVTLHHALDQGVNFLDTADAYGPHSNELLLGEVLKTRRHEVVLATKFGLIRRGVENQQAAKSVDGRPDYVKAACEASLKRLQTDVIDLYYYHRLDPDVAIEETVGAMKDLVTQGKIRHIGLSEMSAATIRRAHQVHPITALQSEYSLWSREVEDNQVLKTLRELNIGFVPYAPLGRGFLSGAIRSIDDLAADDYRRISPRFQGENFQKNLDIVKALENIAQKRGVSAAQLALAWVLAQGDDIVPIPGTRHRDRLDENIKAADIALSKTESETIAALLPDAIGARYPASTLHEIDH